MYSFDGKLLPDWLIAKLLYKNPYPTSNTLFELLLEDYIARNEPKEVKDVKKSKKRKRS